MATTTTSVAECCAAAQRAARKLGNAQTESKDAALGAIARLLGERPADVLEANAADLADERAEALTPALRDRLALSEERVAAMAEGCAPLRRSPIPLARSWSTGHWRAGSTCARSGCRSASSRSSTRRGRT